MVRKFAHLSKHGHTVSNGMAGQTWTDATLLKVIRTTCGLDRRFSSSSVLENVSVLTFNWLGKFLYHLEAKISDTSAIGIASREYSVGHVLRLFPVTLQRRIEKVPNIYGYIRWMKPSFFIRVCKKRTCQPCPMLIFYEITCSGTSPHWANHILKWLFCSRQYLSHWKTNRWMIVALQIYFCLRLVLNAVFSFCKDYRLTLFNKLKALSD